MNATHDPIPVYLDQNVLSELRDGKRVSDELRRALNKLKANNVAFVYSMTHVFECRDSVRPETFVSVLEELPVYLMEFQKAPEPHLTLSLGKARELLLEREEVSHQMSRLMDDMLHVTQFASGWLGDVEVQIIKDEMIAKITAVWETLQNDLDLDELGLEVARRAQSAFTASQFELASIIQSLPFEQIRDEWKKDWPLVRQGLPANFAQLDEVPDDKVVSFLISCLDDRSKEEIKIQTPAGFWRNPAMRDDNRLVGLAFMLFMCGLVRDRRVKSGRTESRLQHFRGQFRDCVHIENAAFCSVFITCDAGAARLARSIYAYAGVETKVVQLKITDTKAGMS
jgi:hypothetical protein